ncbi:hypothetical protein BC832DRAFT_128861 [Gaertneriomyces semiglobifer]|nr:hypothetical protein BC832DRAFT_128861 [Gaertneriomyces semiglobifer]
MLKRHQAIIDLEKNVLRIHGEEVRFLAEHELPAKARWEGDDEENPKSPVEGGSAAQGAIHPAGGIHPHIPPGGISGTVPGPTASTSATPTTASTNAKYSEEKITMLTNLGVSRQEAIAALDAVGGNAEAAASILFQ